MADHILVVQTSPYGGHAWDVEHPDDCPQIVAYEGPPGGDDVMDYNCNIGWQIRDAGDEAFGGVEKLEAGRYRMEFWSDNYHTPGGGIEYNAGIYVTRIEASDG